MKFSMNGFRHSLSKDVADLREIAQAIINGEDYDKDDLAATVDAVISHSNILNSVEDVGNDDFSSLLDVRVPHLDGWDD